MPFIAGTGFHRSLEVRLALLPLTALAAVLLYQATNAALYYVIAMMVYFWAYSEGEVSFFISCFASCFPKGLVLLTFEFKIICAKPWSLPQRGGRASKA